MSGITPEQAAYIAGFFDGEGCVTTTSGQFTVRVAIAQKHPDVLYWIRDILGYGSVYERYAGGCSCYYVTRRSSCIEFLTLVGPYLIVKRDQAAIAMQILELSQDSTGHRYSEEKLQRRSALSAEMSALKQKSKAFRSLATEVRPRMKPHPPSLPGASNPNARLTPEQVGYVKRVGTPGRGYAAIARELGVNERTVKLIVLGKTWL